MTDLSPLRDRAHAASSRRSPTSCAGWAPPPSSSPSAASPSEARWRPPIAPACGRAWPTASFCRWPPRRGAPADENAPRRGSRRVNWSRARRLPPAPSRSPSIPRLIDRDYRHPIRAGCSRPRTRWSTRSAMRLRRLSPVGGRGHARRAHQRAPARSTRSAHPQPRPGRRIAAPPRLPCCRGRAPRRRSRRTWPPAVLLSSAIGPLLAAAGVSLNPSDARLGHAAHRGRDDCRPPRARPAARRGGGQTGRRTGVRLPALASATTPASGARCCVEARERRSGRA